MHGLDDGGTALYPIAAIEVVNAEMASGVDDGIIIGMHPVPDEVLRWSQTRSTGLSSGEYTDSGTGVMVSGAVRSPAPCQRPDRESRRHARPARSFKRSTRETLPCLGVGARHNEGEAVVSTGFDRREDVGEREALVAQPRRALTAPADVAPPFLPADARLVVEEEADAPVF
jgi:hypothetical protein